MTDERRLDHHHVMQNPTSQTPKDIILLTAWAAWCTLHRTHLRSSHISVSELLCRRPLTRFSCNYQQRHLNPPNPSPVLSAYLGNPWPGLPYNPCCQVTSKAREWMALTWPNFQQLPEIAGRHCNMAALKRASTIISRFCGLAEPGYHWKWCNFAVELHKCGWFHWFGNR